MPASQLNCTKTVNGSAPFSTPHMATPGFVMAESNIFPSGLLLCKIVAFMLTGGDTLSVAAFIKRNVTV